MNVRAASVPVSAATAWALASLEQGSGLAAQVNRRIAGAASAFVVAPDDTAVPRIDDESKGLDPRDTDHLLGEYLRYQASVEAGILIVEDDLARRGDPGLEDVVYVGDRVLRWEELHMEPGRLTRLIRRGASGYPLNAFVCAEAGRTVFRRAGDSLSVEDVLGLAQSVRVVINSVYDAESYLVIEADLAA